MTTQPGRCALAGAWAAVSVTQSCTQEGFKPFGNGPTPVTQRTDTSLTDSIRKDVLQNLSQSTEEDTEMVPYTEPKDEANERPIAITTQSNTPEAVTCLHPELSSTPSIDALHDGILKIEPNSTEKTASSSVPPPAKACVQLLPTELVLQILKYKDPSTRFLFKTTCKRFYEIVKMEPFELSRCEKYIINCRLLWDFWGRKKAALLPNGSYDGNVLISVHHFAPLFWPSPFNRSAKQEMHSTDPGF